MEDSQKQTQQQTTETNKNSLYTKDTIAILQIVGELKDTLVTKVESRFINVEKENTLSEKYAKILNTVGISLIVTCCLVFCALIFISFPLGIAILNIPVGTSFLFWFLINLIFAISVVVNVWLFYFLRYIYIIKKQKKSTLLQ